MGGAGRGKKSRAAEGAECANVLVTHDLSASSRTHGGRKELTHGSLLSLKRAVSHTHMHTCMGTRTHSITHTKRRSRVVISWWSEGRQEGTQDKTQTPKDMLLVT